MIEARTPSLPLWVDAVPLALEWRKPEQNVVNMGLAIHLRLKETPGVPQGRRLILFPETTLGGFVTDQPASVALSWTTPSGPSPALKSAADLATQYGVYLGFGYIEINPKNTSRPLNAYVIVDPQGARVAHYHKNYLFTQSVTPDSSEAHRFSAGHEARVFEVAGWRVGIGICFDLRFNRLYDRYFEQAADLVIAPSCWVGGPHKAAQFKALAAARGITTQAYSVALNRSGADPFFHYEGDVHGFNAWGEPISSRPGAEISGHYALDPDHLTQARRLDVRSAFARG